MLTTVQTKIANEQNFKSHSKTHSYVTNNNLIKKLLYYETIEVRNIQYINL